MVSRMEINAITLVAEEREHQKYLAEREKTKKETREYCSTVLSEQLKKEADKPSHSFGFKVSIPDQDGESHLIKLDENSSTYYSEVAGYYNIDTMVEFIKEHGFDVTVEDSTYRYSCRTTYSCKKITIKW
jgi:hypothetical protein